MLSALLPGIRELRTPLITGALWALNLWLLLGANLADAKATKDFIQQFHLNSILTAVLIGAATLIIYLAGSLLVRQSSPLESHSKWIHRKISKKILRLYDPRKPNKRRHIMIWWIWRKIFFRRQFMGVYSWVHGYPRHEDINGWLRNEFQKLKENGLIPIMKSFTRSGTGPSGFDTFCSTASVNEAQSESEGLDERLCEEFIREVKQEKTAVETRIQMKFPGVYDEIDRLKMESELRMSIFWPLLILILVFSLLWLPIVLLLLVTPFMLLGDGFNKANRASEKTWSLLIAGAVTSPILEAMEGAKSKPATNLQDVFNGAV
jgi:hypothetical protein